MVWFMRNRKRRDDRGLEEAINVAGSLTELAARLKTSVQNVSQWRSVPPERCAEVERITGVPRWRLRPDIYETPDDPKRRSSSRVAA
jgi:DNA-binding transcriptional regulator YdaS (Cro superfamily)